MVSNVADRAELLRRLEKAETQVQLYISPSVHFNVCVCVQYREMETSLTKQAAEWVEKKKSEKKVEKTIRWAQVTHTQRYCVNM